MLMLHISVLYIYNTTVVVPLIETFILYYWEAKPTRRK